MFSTNLKFTLLLIRMVVEAESQFKLLEGFQLITHGQLGREGSFKHHEVGLDQALAGLIPAASARPAARSTQTWSQLRENVSDLSVFTISPVK